MMKNLKRWRVGLTALAAPALAASVLAACGGGSEGAGSQETTQVFPGTRTEHQIAIFECVRDNGVEVELLKFDDGDGYGFTQKDETPTEVIVELLDQCNDQVGHPPPPPETEEELRVQYEYRLEDYECLTKAGYPISDPPSFASFVETARTTGWDWHPYQELQPMPPEALEACPRDADTWWR